MGGIGSGRPRSLITLIVEDFASLDVLHLRRAGLLSPGRSGAVPVDQADPDAAVEVNCLGQAVEVRFGGQWLAEIVLTSTPCALGGERTWFVCPICSCRAGKLYLFGSSFRCRQCGGLSYGNRARRAAEKAKRIRVRLGGSGNLLEPFPDKPARLHWKTYDRLRSEAVQAQQELLASVLVDTRRLEAGCARVSAIECR